MKRRDLEHVLRAAAKVTGDLEFIVIGSQAILGEHPNVSEPALVRSVEVDLIPKNHPEQADEIDGSLGEFSRFHETYGYYAQGVDLKTAVLPMGWKKRLVPVTGKNTNGAIGWCLETHDLLASKYAAGRPKDLEFCEAAIALGFVNEETLVKRIAQTCRGRKLTIATASIRRASSGRPR